MPEVCSKEGRPVALLCTRVEGPPDLGEAQVLLHVLDAEVELVVGEAVALAGDAAVRCPAAEVAVLHVAEEKPW